MNISIEQRQKNLNLFKSKLEDCGINTSKLMKLYGEKLQDSTFAFSNKENQFCGDGTLLHTVMRVLTPMALKLNEALSMGGKSVDDKMLIKVCFLHQIAKCVMVSPNDNKWEIENRGLMYKFNDYSFALKMGMRSIAMCIQCGIELTENELEAMSNLDKEETKQTKFYSSPLAVILKQANELTDILSKKN